MRTFLGTLIFLLIGLVSTAQVSSNNLIIQGHITNINSGLAIDNWPISITGMGFSSIVYSDIDGFYSDTLINGSVIGPNQVFYVSAINCDSVSISETVSNNQGTLNLATVDFQLCVASSNCNSIFTHFIDPTIASHVVFQNLSTASDSISHYSWFVDGVLIDSTSYFDYVFPSNEGAEVCLEILSISGCSSSYCQFILPDSNGTCLPFFNYQVSGNNSLSYSFTNTSIISNAEVTYYWYFGDGANSSEENPVHTFSQPGSYSVCLIASTSDCQNTICQNIVVTNNSNTGFNCSAFCASEILPSPDSATAMLVNLFFNGSNNDFINYPYITAVTSISGDTLATGSLNFFGQVGATQQLYPIFSVNGSSLPNNFNGFIHFTFDNQTCVLPYPCVPGCNANFQYNYIGDVPNPSVFIYQFNSAYTTPVNGMLHSWICNDGQVSEEINPVFAFSAGVYTICHSVSTAASACSDSLCYTITVVGDSTAICTSNFSSEISTVQTNQVNYINLSSDLSAAFVWDFGDGFTANSLNAEHVYGSNGLYTVTLTMVGNGCTDAHSEVLTIDSANYLFNMGGFIEGEIFPNPASSSANLSINLTATAALKFTLTSSTGQQIWAITKSVKLGKTEVSIPVIELSEGLYLVNVFNEQGQLLFVRKMQVVH